MKLASISLTTFVLFLSLSVCSQSVDDIVLEYEAFLEYTRTDEPWPVTTESTIEPQLTSLKALSSQINSLDLAALKNDDMINADLLKLIIDDKIFNLEVKSHEMPLSAEGGFLTDIIYTITGGNLETAESQEKFLTKLETLPAYIDSRIEDMRRGQARGFSAPKLITKICLSIVEEISNSPVSDNFFLDQAAGTPIQSDVINRFNTSILPAYKKLAHYLQNDYLPNAPQDIGISSTTGGKEYYQQRIRYYATDDISPTEVFEMGMSEVKRIKAEMQTIIDDLGFEGSFAEFCNFLRTDPQFYPQSSKELLHYAAWITKEMEGKLPNYFNKLPTMPLTVKPVPTAIAPNYTTGRYSPGSYENNKAGQYWVNTTKLESRPLYVMPSLSLHEGVPGHHTQIMLAAELDLPDFRKSQYLSAFGEGWALYCEYLGKEAGMYHTPYEDFGRLVYEMWRACRLVVDPGMHYMGWSREEAFDFLKENTALSLHEVGTEINRYIGWPGQAVSYKLGELKIRSLRKYAESELGKDFDIKTFHDKILENGSIPMTTLERIIKSWVAENKMK